MSWTLLIELLLGWTLLSFPAGLLMGWWLKKVNLESGFVVMTDEQTQAYWEYLDSLPTDQLIERRA